MSIMNCQQCGTTLELMDLGVSLADYQWDYQCPQCHPDSFGHDKDYNSSQLKLIALFYNKSHQLGHSLQEMRDVFEIIRLRHPELMVGDAICILERQLRIVDLEIENLKTATRKVSDLIENKFKK